jgi:hypothetical protein
MFTRGGIYNFSYLWAWQEEKGEESGRKVRPACLLVKAPVPSQALYLFPITTTEPDSARLMLPIPHQEIAGAGLGRKCWIILDECNQTSADSAFDFESLLPIGSFSTVFLKRIALAIQQGAQNQRITTVKRS